LSRVIARLNSRLSGESIWTYLRNISQLLVIKNYYGPRGRDAWDAPATWRADRMPRISELRPAIRRPEHRSGHVFISYVREDAARVDRLQAKLESKGLRVWRDTADLWPGENWEVIIRDAITDNALAFIGCFSHASASRAKSYQNEELAVAIAKRRQHQPGREWLFPVRLDDCEIPEFNLGGGETLDSIHRADLFGDRYDQEADRLVESIRRTLGRRRVGRGWGLAGPGALAAAAVAFVTIRALTGLPGTPSSPATATGSTSHRSSGTPSSPGGPAVNTSHLYSGTAYPFDFPSAIAAAGNHVWVVNNSNNTVAELNASTDSLERGPLPEYGAQGAEAIAVAGGHVWVANSLDGSVGELSESTGRRVQDLSGGQYGFGEPDGIAVYGGDVWIAGFGNLVTEVNASNARLVKRLSAAGYGVDGQDSIAADSGHVWVANEEADTVTEVDTGDGKLVQTLHASRDGFAGPCAIVADGTHVWVVNRSGNSVTELNESDGSLVRVLPAASYGFASPDAIAPDGTHVWVANGDSNSVTELNQSDGSYVRTISAAGYGFSAPSAIAVDSAGIWVANEYGNSVTELSA
jgi:DNA-binding beta-propeller fold protein YncE